MRNVTYKASKGFWGNNGKWYLVYCLKCDRENYSAAVSSGICAFCEYEPVKDGDGKTEPAHPVEHMKP